MDSRRKQHERSYRVARIDRSRADKRLEPTTFGHNSTGGDLQGTVIRRPRNQKCSALGSTTKLMRPWLGITPKRTLLVKSFACRTSALEFLSRVFDDERRLKQTITTESFLEGLLRPTYT